MDTEETRTVIGAAARFLCCIKQISLNIKQ